MPYEIIVNKRLPKWLKPLLTVAMCCVTVLAILSDLLSFLLNQRSFLLIKTISFLFTACCLLIGMSFSLHYLWVVVHKSLDITVNKANTILGTKSTIQHKMRKLVTVQLCSGIGIMLLMLREITLCVLVTDSNHNIKPNGDMIPLWLTTLTIYLHFSLHFDQFTIAYYS